MSWQSSVTSNLNFRCSLWLRYGILTNENIVIYVNIVGVVLMFGYSLCYFVFTISKKAFAKQFVGAVLALCFSVYLTMVPEDDPKTAIDTLGELEVFSYKHLAFCIDFKMGAKVGR